MLTVVRGQSSWARHSAFFFCQGILQVVVRCMMQAIEIQSRPSEGYPVDGKPGVLPMIHLIRRLNDCPAYLHKLSSQKNIALQRRSPHGNPCTGPACVAIVLRFDHAPFMCGGVGGAVDVPKHSKNSDEQSSWELGAPPSTPPLHQLQLA